MARTINILPENLANKIAAGEVIQRPASVVKELAENSIDAGANSITVIIKESGRNLIQIIDDGCGMSSEDAAIAFERHATSKISTYEDLENIRTLGFRGEALSSIAAISQVELKSRKKDTDVGTRVRIEGGLLLEITEDAAAIGTSIAVKNLFYNTPARRNFLKSNATEFRHIFDVLQRLAISRPEAGLNFISDEESILRFQPAPLDQRVLQIFGEKMYESVFFFEEKSEFGTVSGFLGKPALGRKARVDQFLFLNSRPITNRSISHAVFQAYENLLEKGSFPFYVLFLSVDPHRVDVNVHPTKLEVKFDDEQAVHRLIVGAVRNALSEHNIVPSVMMGDADSLRGTLRSFPTGSQPLVPSSSDRWRELLRIGNSQLNVARKDRDSQNENSDENSQSQPSGDSTRPGGQGDAFSLVSAGIPMHQIHNKYIIVQTGEGFIIIDQHAAHERVLYEQAVARFNGAGHESQQLLFPQTIDLNPADAALLRDLQAALESLGFSLKFFGKATIIVEGVPVEIKAGTEGSILQGILDLIKADEQSAKLEPRERLAKSYSCKAAIKAGDALSEPEMRSLLDQLFSTKIPFVCPHGRPAIINFSISELDRRFGRPG